MSAIPSYTLICDGMPDGLECESDTPNMDLGRATAAEARQQGKYQGWQVGQPGGKDFCPDCVAAGIARASNVRERAKAAARRGADR